MIAKTWKQPGKFINRGMDKEDMGGAVYTHIHNGILFSHENKIMPRAATWMDLETVILSEVGQTQKNSI